jgi:hypothetical protein
MADSKQEVEEAFAALDEARQQELAEHAARLLEQQRAEAS